MPNAESLLQTGLCLGSQGRILGVLRGSGPRTSSRMGQLWVQVPARAGNVTPGNGAAPAAVLCWEMQSKTPALKRPVRLGFGRGSGNLTEQGELWRAGQGEHSSSVGAHNGVPVAAATRDGIVCCPKCACAPRAEPLAANEFKIHRQGRGQVAISAR